MNIAMVTTAHRHDDVRICHKEAKTLVRAGFRVTILSPDYEGEEDGILFCRIAVPSGRLGRLAGGAAAALRTMETLGADVCHLHDPELLPMAAALRRRSVLTVYDAHEDLPASLAARDWLPRALRPAASLAAGRLLALARRCDGVVAATEGIAKRFPGAVLVRNRVTGEEAARFEAASARPVPAGNSVCYAGAISERRGIRQMVRACDAAGATLLLAGRFESDALRQSLERMPQYRCVRYLGTLGRKQIAALYGESRAGLLLLEDTPAYRESEPIKLCEYLCAGLPVAASDFAHWRALAPDGEIRWVSPDDPADAARQIHALISDDAPLRRAKEQSGRMRGKYSFEPDAARLISLYRRLEAKLDQHPVH